MAKKPENMSDAEQSVFDSCVDKNKLNNKGQAATVLGQLLTVGAGVAVGSIGGGPGMAAGAAAGIAVGTKVSGNLVDMVGGEKSGAELDKVHARCSADIASWRQKREEKQTVKLKGAQGPAKG